MRIGRLPALFIATSLALALATPTVLAASPWVITRGIIGVETGVPTFTAPDISGSSIVYGRRWDGLAHRLHAFNLARGAASWALIFNAGGIDWQAVSGDWAVWQNNGDIGASGPPPFGISLVTTDHGDKLDERPAVSTADGAYVVWQQQSAGQYDVRYKALGTTGLSGTLAGGVGNQTFPSIYGKRVAYLDDSSGVNTVYVKTIGAGSASLKLTSDGKQQWSPDIGDHLVAWVALNASGQLMIRYYDFDTGLVYDGPTSTTYNMVNPQVSGDRILYNRQHGPDYDLCVWDTRIAKSSTTMASIEITSTVLGDLYGRMEGNQIAYLSGNVVYYARLGAPSISLKSVPTRIAHGGHIHLTGSISDRGHRIGGATIGIEKYASGVWTRVKTMTASTTGTFSYKSPRTYSKTKYRVVYNGRMSLFAAPAGEHLSTRSAVKTAWPR
jgi:hypothetical protein